MRCGEWGLLLGSQTFFSTALEPCDLSHSVVYRLSQKTSFQINFQMRHWDFIQNHHSLPQISNPCYTATPFVTNFSYWVVYARELDRSLELVNLNFFTQPIGPSWTMWLWSWTWRGFSQSFVELLIAKWPRFILIWQANVGRAFVYFHWLGKGFSAQRSDSGIFS